MKSTKILALNSGSSSVKFLVYDWDKRAVFMRGRAERIGQSESLLSYGGDNAPHVSLERSIKDHEDAVRIIFTLLKKDDIAAAAHRVVHGGAVFSQSVLIDEYVEKEIHRLEALAPLHNPPNLAGIIAAKAHLPSIPHAAVFDTAFHHSMPPKAYMYPLPYEWYEKHRVRRYGFHGTSHLYVSKRAAAMLKKPASECNLITCHLGNGVSVTAIENGLSTDTSMGLTPLEGLMMGTRSGDIDPSITLYMQVKAGIDRDEMYRSLNSESGFKGIAGYTDMRDLLRHEKTDARCHLALEMSVYRLKQYIGKYFAVMPHVDAVVFTAGIGENSPEMRERVMRGLEKFGITLDEGKNYEADGESEISAEGSPVKALMIPTNEEQVLVEDAVGILNGTYTDHMNYRYSFC